MCGGKSGLSRKKWCVRGNVREPLITAASALVGQIGRDGACLLSTILKERMKNEKQPEQKRKRRGCEVWAMHQHVN